MNPRRCSAGFPPCQGNCSTPFRADAVVLLIGFFFAEEAGGQVGLELSFQRSPAGPDKIRWDGPGRSMSSSVGEDYLLYQKIASATRTTVMIQRMMSLLRLFSSAIDGSTTHLKSRFKYQLNSRTRLMVWLQDLFLPACSR